MVVARNFRRQLGGLPAAMCVAVVMGCWPGRAYAMDCSVSAYTTTSRTRDRAILEGGGLASGGRWADARAVYLWVLARNENDAEALFGLARVDAWGGCWSLSESEYRAALAAHPNDADVRAGYVDLLIWRGRIADAQRALEEGLAIDPQSPQLVGKAAKFAAWRGDASLAVALAAAAERGAPEDRELRAMADRFFVGEARVITHLDVYPPGRQNVYATTAQVLQRIGRFELTGGAQLLDHFGNGTSSFLDARYPFGVAYHPALGMMVGLELTPGAPANAIPHFALRAWSLFPIAGPLDASLAYSFWEFDGGESVSIFNPGVGIALPGNLRLDLRSWVSAVRLPPSGLQTAQTKVVAAAGLQLTWSVTRRIDLSLAYTYGAEADPSQTVAGSLQLQASESHIATAFADILLHRHFGVRPLAMVERLAGPSAAALWIEACELGGYARW